MRNFLFFFNLESGYDEKGGVYAKDFEYIKVECKDGRMDKGSDAALLPFPSEVSIPKYHLVCYFKTLPVFVRNETS